MDKFQINTYKQSGLTNIVLLLIIIVCVLLIFSIYSSQQKNTKDTNSHDSKVIIVNKEVPVNHPHINKIYDPIKDRDYSKSYDPLEEPTKRVPRHGLPPIHLRPHFNISTRGPIDNYNQIGYLTNKNSKDNEIIRLFGREIYPGSNKWEYYTSLNSGNDSIKIPIDIKKNELYTDDTINILNNNYKVNIYKNEELRYNPYII